MKRIQPFLIIFSLLHFYIFTGAPAVAQNTRASQLQNAKNLTITTSDQQTYYYLVSAIHNHTMHRGGGKVIVQRDTFNVSKIRSMRFISLPRFSLNEDSTAFAGDYSINHGLLALRRSMNLNTWNTLVLPFSLTGSQVRETFGEDALLAQPRAITESDVATIEFNTIPLSGDDVVIETGGFYLIRPTREPDLPQGELTSVVYGNGRVNGPVYIIPNVTMASGQKIPSSESLRSNEEQVRVRFFGTYVSQDLERENRDVYYVNDEGRYALLNETQTLKAFRSWIEVVRNNNALPFRFYIDGIADITQGTENIYDLQIDDLRFDGKAYDLNGRSYSPSTLYQIPANAPTRSLSPSTRQKILISNGKKYLTR